MKARSSLVLLLAAVQCITVVVARSDVFCLTKNDCKQRQEVLGFETFKSGGKYGKIGRGCFSKDNTLYYSGGSYAQKTTLDMGSSDTKRVMCGGTDKVSTVVTTSEPTNKPTHEPTSEPTREPTAEPTVITDAPTDAETETDTEESIIVVGDTIDENENGTSISETEDEVTTNYTEYKNATSLNDDGDSGAAEAVQIVEEKEAYLPNSTNQRKTFFLEIGAAGAAAGVLLIALFIHRRRKRSRLQAQRSNNDAIDDEATEPSKAVSFDVENGSVDTPKNTIEVFEAESANIVDDLGCWAPAEYLASSSFEGSSDLYWASSASGNESSLYTKDTKEDSVASSKVLSFI